MSQSPISTVNVSHAEATYQLANAYQAQGRLDEAIACYAKVIKMAPDAMACHFNMGNALLRRGRLAEAVACYRAAIRLSPDMPEAFCNMATALKELGEIEAAVDAYKKAISLRPGYADAFHNLGYAYHQTGRLTEAIRCYQKAVALDSNRVEAYNNLALALKEKGEIPDSIRYCRKALEMRPGYAEAHSNLLFAMQCDPDVGDMEIFRESVNWWRRHGAGHAREAGRGKDPDPGRRLRVGYVSPDFREHSVSRFFLPLIENHDRKAVEVFCYGDVKRPDRMTARIRELADHWRSIVGLGDDAVARQIWEDRIDILVDLAGHTGGNRLLVFARRPAPVQVTWLGYPGTTGLGVMDYRLTDHVADPEGDADRWHTERLVRLSEGFLCYAPPEEAGEVCSLPALKEGRVTFGSFNNFSKMNEQVAAVWSRILLSVPGSLLMLKSKSLRDAGVRGRCLEMFLRNGISEDRIVFEGYARTVKDHLLLYNRVDMGLDPFPYNGTTTTCEALWMGVPVVTLKGGRHAARVGASILTRVGLSDLIADTKEAYIRKAVELARDPGRLKALRAGMRDRLRKSTLLNGPGFAAAMEAAYQGMWRTAGTGPILKPKETATG